MCFFLANCWRNQGAVHVFNQGCSQHPKYKGGNLVYKVVKWPISLSCGYNLHTMDWSNHVFWEEEPSCNLLDRGLTQCETRVVQPVAQGFPVQPVDYQLITSWRNICKKVSEVHRWMEGKDQAMRQPILRKPEKTRPDFALHSKSKCKPHLSFSSCSAQNKGIWVKPEKHAPKMVVDYVWRKIWTSTFAQE